MAKTIHPYFKNRILEMVELGYSAPDILKTFELSTPDHLHNQIPSLRTIQRLVKAKSKENRREWKITDCENPEDAAIILSALRYLVGEQKSPRLSLDYADMIIRVCKADPNLPMKAVVKLALHFMTDYQHIIDDALLVMTFKPYAYQEEYSAYTAYLKEIYGDVWKVHALYKVIQKDGRIAPIWDFYADWVEIEIMGLCRILEDCPQDVIKS